MDSVLRKKRQSIGRIGTTTKSHKIRPKNTLEPFLAINNTCISPQGSRRDESSRVQGAGTVPEGCHYKSSVSVAIVYETEQNRPAGLFQDFGTGLLTYFCNFSRQILKQYCPNMSKSCILYSSEHEVLFPKAAKFVKMKTMIDIFGHT